MTRRVPGGGVVIEMTPPATCELCGKLAELRPYGPNGEHVCYRCAMKNRAAAEARFAQLLGVDVPPAAEA